MACVRTGGNGGIHVSTRKLPPLKGWMDRGEVFIPSTNDTSYTGRGDVGPSAAKSIGVSFLPEFRHMWRAVGPRRELAARYVDDISEIFSNIELRPLADRGDQLVRQCKGYTMRFWNSRRRECVPRHVNYPSIVKTVTYFMRNTLLWSGSLIKVSERCMAAEWGESHESVVYRTIFPRRQQRN